jgi:hypothetical protein
LEERAEKLKKAAEKVAEKAAVIITIVPFANSLNSLLINYLQKFYIYTTFFSLFEMDQKKNLSHMV